MAETNIAYDVALEVRRIAFQQHFRGKFLYYVFLPLISVGTYQADSFYASFVYLIEHLTPAVCSFGGLVIDAYNFSSLVLLHCEQNKERFCVYVALAMDLYVNTIYEQYNMPPD